MSLTEPPLSPEQAKLVDIIMSGHNVFYTGSAGSGKSTVLKAFTKKLQDQERTVHIIAPTGRAALQVGGSTIWSYAGWTPDSMKEGIEALLQDAQRKHCRKRLRNTDVLVIDEISMIENFHFERLNAIMKMSNRSDMAFGGVQLVVTGDFYQLPPVQPFRFCIKCGSEMIIDRTEGFYTCTEHGRFYDEDKWAFRSQAWEECNFVHFALKSIHRQSDETFIRALQTIRIGDPLTEGQTNLLMDHPCVTTNATRLYASRNEVRELNTREFKRISATKYTYKCVDSFLWNEKGHPHLESKNRRAKDKSLLALSEHQYESYVELKQGMLVVLLYNLNLSQGLCNGSQGIICGFASFDPTKSLTVTQNKRDTDPTKPLEDILTHITSSQTDKFIKQVETKVWPVVRFHNGLVRVIAPHCSTTCLGDEQPYSILSRTQIPLAPAWAMTIHKSQSLTLDRVIVDLSKAFVEGQVYVALSRARSLKGLKIEGSPKDLMAGVGASPEVRKFYKRKFGI